MKSPTSHKLPRRFGFLLVNDLTLISLASVIEPLRMANRISREDYYEWVTLSESGESITASDGLRLQVDRGTNDKNALEGLDAVIVCGGRRIEKNVSRPLLNWLKLVNKKGMGLGAICTGSYVLAEAGLLDGFRCSIHWENMASLTDLFQNVAVNRNIYTIDRNRYTSSGGTTPTDMMLYFIRAQRGADIASGVAEQFIFERIRQSDDEQRIPLRYALGNQSEKLVVAADLMDANVKELISQEDLASYVGLSRRQLQRLFHRYLSCTPSRYYLQIRLQRARQLLRQTGMSLVEISASTGFASSSHFSKSYKEYYGHSPSNERRELAL